MSKVFSSAKTARASPVTESCHHSLCTLAPSRTQIQNAGDDVHRDPFHPRHLTNPIHRTRPLFQSPINPSPYPSPSPKTTELAQPETPRLTMCTMLIDNDAGAEMLATPVLAVEERHAAGAGGAVEGSCSGRF